VACGTAHCRSKGGNSKELDPELRKRLLEQCPELAGLEDALSAMGSDAADWLIDFNKLELGYRIGSGTSSVVFRCRRGKAGRWTQLPSSVVHGVE
jgi:hypothetical protein